MLLYIATIACALTQQVILADAAPSSTWPAPFDSGFRQPLPPTIKPEFKANWNQHKWNANVSNIASGYIYSSPSQQKIRADEAYDGTLGSSLFDFANLTEAGILNTQWTLSPAVASKPQFFVGYVQPAFILLSADFLTTVSAVYGGTVNDAQVGKKAKWNFLYLGTPVTVLVDADGVVHGYDFWSPVERTYAITRFFNIAVGQIDKKVFKFPQA